MGPPENLTKFRSVDKLESRRAFRRPNASKPGGPAQGVLRLLSAAPAQGQEVDRRRAVGGRRSSARDVPPHGPGDHRAFPAQPSPADPDGEDQDQEQRQSWSELDEEQEVGHRRYADAIVEARPHFSCFGVVEAGDHGFRSFGRD